MITAVVLARNEEKNIVDCLESISFCDEILLIDDNSSDRTVEIGRKLGARIVKRALNKDFSAQRNFALSIAKNDWILFVDADERVTKNLQKEINDFIIESKNDAAFIKRVDFIWGKQLMYGETGNVKFLRLGKRQAGEWIGRIHEEWRVTQNIGSLKNSLYHFPHQSIGDFLKEINYYTDIRAIDLHAVGMKVKWHSLILYPGGKFFANFFIKLGFLDGIYGLMFAIMMSFHSFLVRGKLWMLNQKKN